MVDRWTRSPENRRLLSLPLRSVINLSEAVSKSLRNSYRSPVRRISLSPDTASLSVSVANQTDGRNYLSDYATIVSFPPALGLAQIVSNTVPRIPWISGFPILLYNFAVVESLSLFPGYLIIFHSTFDSRIDDSPPPSGIRESTRIENLLLCTTTIVSKGRMVGKHERLVAAISRVSSARVTAQRR